MSKLLFNLPRPTVPIFTRCSRLSAVAASAAEGNNTSDDGKTRTSASAWVKSDLDFPIRRIYCVGRNYREHAIEMGGNPDREPPFFFQKPSDAIVVCNPTSSTAPCVPYPPATSSLHFEGELVVAVGKGGLRIPVDDAMDHVYGYSIGCDLTRRDLQAEAKKMRRPWDASKGFDHSCPMSPVVPKEDATLDGDANIQLDVNGSVRQQSTIGAMIYSVPEIVSNLSQLFRLQQGDLILTGTPAGVSDLNVGDKVTVTCGDLIPCNFVMGDAE
mmetsp:Transcript_28922/g.61084  ORF Transcript_28922/g.61084 Transcript_28922/m.61084 type:complete len:271 (+) Transcript_28922:49-861(+)